MLVCRFVSSINCPQSDRFSSDLVNELTLLFRVFLDYVARPCNAVQIARNKRPFLTDFHLALDRRAPSSLGMQRPLFGFQLVDQILQANHSDLVCQAGKQRSVVQDTLIELYALPAHGRTHCVLRQRVGIVPVPDGMRAASLLRLKHRKPAVLLP